MVGRKEEWWAAGREAGVVTGGDNTAVVCVGAGGSCD